MVTAPKHHTPLLPGHPSVAPEWHHPQAPASGGRLAPGEEPGPQAGQWWAEMGAQMGSGRGQGGRRHPLSHGGDSPGLQAPDRVGSEGRLLPKPIATVSLVLVCRHHPEARRGAGALQSLPRPCPLRVFLLSFLRSPPQPRPLGFPSGLRVAAHLLTLGLGHCRGSAPEGTQVPQVQVQLSVRASLCLFLPSPHCQPLPERHRAPGPLAG